MKYTVNIEGVINDILKNNIGIGPALEKRCHERSHTRWPWYQPILELYEILP